LVSPGATRSAIPTSATAYGDGGTKKSAELTAVPSGVFTVMRPDVAVGGTRPVIAVVLAASTGAITLLNEALS